MISSTRHIKELNKNKLNKYQHEKLPGIPKFRGIQARDVEGGDGQGGSCSILFHGAPSNSSIFRKKVWGKAINSAFMGSLWGVKLKIFLKIGHFCIFFENVKISKIVVIYG